MEPELIADYACEVGEGPLWHSDEQRVYWVDIPKGRIFRYEPGTGRHEVFYEAEDEVGGFTIQADGSLLLFMSRGSVAVLRDGRLDRMIDEIPDETSTRFNDVIADPAGRVFCGTMATEDRRGKLYRLDLDGSIRPVVDDIGISNGLGFTLDHRQMYYTDSTARKIYLFDYDVDTGEISDQRLFVETPEGEGIPDGMTVDAQGYVWSARWGGSALFRYTPDGVLERRVDFPTKKMTSVIFAGPEYKDMYVTTAGGPTKDEDGPGAGALYRLNLGIEGLPEFDSRVGL